MITALVDLIEYIIDIRESWNTLTNIFLDLSKAFDFLNHKLALRKLRSLGVSGMALKWFNSYLSGCSEIIELKQTINGAIRTARSSPLNLKRGSLKGLC